MKKISFFILLWVLLCMFFSSQDAFSNVSPDGRDANVVMMDQDVVAQLQSGSYIKVDLLLAELPASKKNVNSWKKRA